MFCHQGSLYLPKWTFAFNPPIASLHEGIWHLKTISINSWSTLRKLSPSFAVPRISFSTFSMSLLLSSASKSSKFFCKRKQIFSKIQVSLICLFVLIVKMHPSCMCITHNTVLLIENVDICVPYLAFWSRSGPSPVLWTLSEALHTFIIHTSTKTPESNFSCSKKITKFHLHLKGWVVRKLVKEEHIILSKRCLYIQKDTKSRDTPLCVSMCFKLKN